ncbi:MAG TPA: ABC transporter ATP-binding protein [Armatimonadetes bacterium]|nr:ABC transporter ATP-binding protein [Armatimonadota bacterium]
MSTKREVSVELYQVGKWYGHRRVFVGVSARVEWGKVLVVAGPNGSGKTTLLRILSGLTRPTRGEVVLRLDGRVLAPAEWRFYLGLVAPEVALYEELTAEENVEFFARVRGLGLKRGEIEKRLAQVGLAERGRDLVGEFSTGLKQRLKFALALVHDPPILLLDEPGTNLDEAGRALVEQVIAVQRRRGVTVLATNNPREVEYGDQVLQLGA